MGHSGQDTKGVVILSGRQLREDKGLEETVRAKSLQETELGLKCLRFREERDQQPA